jgi:ribosome-binding factor A
MNCRTELTRNLWEHSQSWLKMVVGFRQFGLLRDGRWGQKKILGCSFRSIDRDLDLEYFALVHFHLSMLALRSHLSSIRVILARSFSQTAVVLSDISEDPEEKRVSRRAGLRAKRQAQKEMDREFGTPEPDADDWFAGEAVPATFSGCQIHVPKAFHSVMTGWRRAAMAPLRTEPVVPRAAPELRPREGLKPSTRQLRVGELLEQVLGRELAVGGVRDPRLRHVRIAEVKVTRDMHFAHVFWDLDGPGDERLTTAALAGAAGMLRSHLARELAMRRVPALMFRRDPVPERLAALDRALAAAAAATAPAAPRPRGRPRKAAAAAEGGAI